MIQNIKIILSIIMVTLSALSAYSQMSVVTDSKNPVDGNIISEENRTECTHKYAPYRHIVSNPVLPDSADVRLHGHKAFWRAGVETVGFNIGLWAFDRYVLKGHYAYISWNTIKENFRHGFEWDDDHLHTNMFDHPYNGSIFFNAGRSNGFNFWQSELFAIGGSAMWEMFMEREYPSTNDIIATPIGGAALGEVLYRTSDLILDDRSTGGERFGRELAAFLVDPMKGINRIVTGAAWKKRTTSGRRFGIPPISVELSLGGRFLSLIENDEGSRGGAVAEINIEYGDRFAETTKAPYDYFSFLMELQGIKSQPLLSRVEITGRLLSKEILERKNVNLNVGLYQHFDYFDSDTIRPERNAMYFPCSVPYKMGTPASVGGGVMIKYTPSKLMSLDGYVHLNGIILAGVLTDFYRDYHRNYNWGSGFSVKAGVNWALSNDRLSVRLANQFYKIYTWNGYDANYDWSLTPEGKPVDVQGDASHSSFNHLEASVNYRLWKRLYLTGGIDYYSRRTEYTAMTIHAGNTTISSPIVCSKQLGFHLVLTYKL